ncbi:MAG: chemotaxis protein CheD [Syntrophaceae bacterium]|nr:chemotaxis protein CheD [Syntrophaceae bacterium]
MSELVVSIADFKVSNNPAEVLVTYALGSCIGLAIYDPRVRVGGLLHFMLPDSSQHAAKAKENPAMFADTGIPLLFKSCYALGAEKKHLVVKVAGGSNVLDDANYFRIGQKNITALRKIFWRNNVMIDSEDTGQNFNRTVHFDIASGKCTLKCSNGTVKDL